jgi:hypothetical protein
MSVKGSQRLKDVTSRDFEEIGKGERFALEPDRYAIYGQMFIST